MYDLTARASMEPVMKNSLTENLPIKCRTKQSMELFQFI